MVCGTGSEWVGPKHHRGTAMEYFAGIDVSLKGSSICVVDAAGRIVREAKVASEPEALIAWFGGLGLAVTRIGLEAGPLSQWLHGGLTGAGFWGFFVGNRDRQGGPVGVGGQNAPQRRPGTARRV